MAKIKSGSGTAIWNITTLIVTLAGIAVPAWVALHLYQAGPSPEKHVELGRIGPMNPMNDLVHLGDVADLILKFGDESVDNIVIEQATFRNTGSAPIVPADYTEKLSATIPPPWKIVRVKNQNSFGLQLKWNRVSDQRYEAEPALLNPGDMVWAVVYLTNPNYVKGQSNADPPPVDWQARIINLRGFYEKPGPLANLQESFANRYAILVVMLGGWSLLFTVICAMTFQLVYLHLGARAGYLRRWGWQPLILILCASLLSFSAADALATLVYGNTITDIQGQSFFLNAFPLAIHVTVICILYFKGHSKTVRNA